ncbi:Acetyltransferase (GNAT) domain-containing protein [Lentzea xinjiangensis]|uniref:Acetyltransferase (GNAT) domain-containing protein n=1 Tax=Lentzea xinjiangensis TaxID=402600 RepID=A0A1H9MTM8_9PSEU|nr:Acetyltransferase (GNAT) domain-containing protein [Lentzea xinjiangensis]
MVSAWVAEGDTDRDPPPYEACVIRWTSRDELGFGPARFVVARDGGKIVGHGQVNLSEAEANAHLALATVVVHPHHRRRGIGTALLRAVPPLLDGRTVVESWSVIKGNPGEQFAAARGFRVVTTMTRQRLKITELPEAGEVPAGYDLVTWKGAAPEEFVAAYVDGLNAIADAPFGETTLDDAHRTVESIREDEAAAVADRWVVLLLHGNEPAGVTVVERNPVVPTIAEQLHTVVLPAHRGKALGKLIKARMLHELDGVEQIFTRTSSDNEHMLRVNHSLGYTDQYTYMAVQAKAADLRP